MLKVSEAAKLAGVSKATLHRARSEGRLSASRDDRGHYIFDPSEILRVFPNASRESHETLNEAMRESQRDDDETVEMRLKLASVEKERDAANQLAQERAETIDDLRDRLDKEGEERRKLTAMITDQRVPADGDSGRQSRLWLAVLFALVVGGLAVWAVTQLPIASA